MLAATLVPSNRAAKFQNAAHTTATRGVSTRVETTVAIEFAASWKPLKKSKASATRTTKTTAPSGALCMLQGDGLDRVRDVLTGVDGAFHLVHDVLPLQHVHGLELPGVQAGHGLAVHAVSLVLQPIDLDEVAVLVAERPQTPDGLPHRLGDAEKHVGLLAQLGKGLVDAVQRDQVRHSFLAVQHVVQPRGQPVDVVAIERGDERRVERGHDAMGDLVALVLEALDSFCASLPVVEVLDEILQLSSA